MLTIVCGYGTYRCGLEWEEPLNHMMRYQEGGGRAAGQLCCVELQNLANQDRDIYVALNIIIFVVAFLADGLVCWLTYRLAKRDTLRIRRRQRLNTLR